MPSINIAAVNLTVKAVCEFSWIGFKQDIEVISMEGPASCKSLAANGIMVRHKAYPAKQSRTETRNVLLMM